MLLNFIYVPDLTRFKRSFFVCIANLWNFNICRKSGFYVINYGNRFFFFCLMFSLAVGDTIWKQRIEFKWSKTEWSFYCCLSIKMNIGNKIDFGYILMEIFNRKLQMLTFLRNKLFIKYKYIPFFLLSNVFFIIIKI